MNSALIVEECYREAKDNNIDFQLILLDAKAGVFLTGIDNRHWNRLMSINVYDGVDFEDLYKLCINPLLDRLETSRLGLEIGNISISNTACADDIALISETPNEAQRLVNMVTDFAFMEGYQLQPTKSVVINVSSKKNQTYNS